jgi:ATP-dependent DNA helicase RecQ
MLTTFREPHRATQAKKRSSAPAFEAGSDQQKQFETLRAVRTRLAKATNVPAYVVMSDRSLRELCTEQPRSLSDLASIHGFGKVKIQKFGQAFLDALLTAET